MKEVKQYKCETCGTLYAIKDQCEMCEKQHRIPAEIQSAHHLPMNVSAKYPTRIIVKFDDGSTRTYNLGGGR